MDTLREKFTTVWSGIAHFGRQLKSSSTLTKVWVGVFCLVLLVVIVLAAITLYVASTDVFTEVQKQVGDISVSLMMSGMSLQALQAKNIAFLRQTPPLPPSPPSPAPSPNSQISAAASESSLFILFASFLAASVVPTTIIFALKKNGPGLIKTARALLKNVADISGGRAQTRLITQSELAYAIRKEQSAKRVVDVYNRLYDIWKEYAFDNSGTSEVRTEVLDRFIPYLDGNYDDFDNAYPEQKITFAKYVDEQSEYHGDLVSIDGFLRGRSWKDYIASVKAIDKASVEVIDK